MKRALAAVAVIVTAVTSEASAQQVPPAPQPQPVPQPQFVVWPRLYLRGDAGGAFSSDTHFRDTNFDTPTLGDDVRLNGNSGNSPIFDLGVGARFSPFFRADLTFSALPSLRFSGSDNIGLGTSNTANIHSWVGLANAYFDFWPLPTIFGPIQPYIDIGVGAARNHIGSFSSTFIGGALSSNTHTDVAVGVGAGLGIPVSRNVTLDLAYKYLDLGEVRTGSTTTTVGAAPIKAYLAAHTVTLGARFGF